MKTLLILGAIAAVVALAYIAGQQMSADAMAVVVGVVVGIAASIPTSLVMLMLFGQRRDVERPAQREAPPPPAVYFIEGYSRPALPAGRYRVLDAQREEWQ